MDGVCVCVCVGGGYVCATKQKRGRPHQYLHQPKQKKRHTSRQAGTHQYLHQLVVHGRGVAIDLRQDAAHVLLRPEALEEGGAEGVCDRLVCVCVYVCVCTQVVGA